MAAPRASWARVGAHAAQHDRHGRVVERDGDQRALQIVWSVEMSNAPAYLLTLRMSRAAMSVVFVAGPGHTTTAHVRACD